MYITDCYTPQQHQILVCNLTNNLAIKLILISVQGDVLTSEEGSPSDETLSVPSAASTPAPSPTPPPTLAPALTPAPSSAMTLQRVVTGRHGKTHNLCYTCTMQKYHQNSGSISSYIF